MKNSKTIMNMSLAEVRENVASHDDGTFYAKIRALGNLEKKVYYTSPFATGGEGGQIFIPPPGVEVMVCSPYGSTNWYYLGSTFAQEPGDAEGDRVSDSDIPPIQRVDPKMYRARGIPQRHAIKGSRGGGVTISEEYNPEYYNIYTEMKATTGKKVRLNDNPQTDALELDSGNGASIRLTNDPTAPMTPSRAILAESVGPQKFINKESETDIIVHRGGRDINILNEANGETWGDDISCGNVNIQSTWKDVNVFTQAESGRIFIECVKESGDNQLIQIETNGDNGAIVIKTKGDVILDAQRDVNINAGRNLNMRCGGKFSVNAGGSSELQSGGNTNIEAPQIHLAEGASPTAPSTEGQQSSFGNAGVTKYN
jgi:hypothetical protein